MQESLSIILPCYSPVPDWEKNVVENVARIRAQMPLQELIIVNDGSKQDLTQAVQYIRRQVPVDFHYIHYPNNRGKGYAIRRGLEQASCPLIIYTDIDFPYTLDSLKEIYVTLEKPTNAIVIGVKDEKYYNTVPPLRKWISKSLRKMIALTFNLATADTQCGLKGIRSDVKNIWLEGKIDRYLFDLEAIRNASKKNIPVIPLPVTLRDGVSFSKIPFLRLMKEVKNFLALMAGK